MPEGYKAKFDPRCGDGRVVYLDEVFDHVHIRSFDLTLVSLSVWQAICCVWRTDEGDSAQMTMGFPRYNNVKTWASDSNNRGKRKLANLTLRLSTIRCVIMALEEGGR